MLKASTAIGVPRKRTVVLPRGVDLEHYRAGLDTGHLRRELELADGGPVILSPRYQVDQGLYNLDVVIDAFSIVRRSLPGAVCVQLFDPKHDAGILRLARLAESRNLGAAYRLVPLVDNELMPLFYNLADVVVSVPS
jgi:hypothetical protein